MSAQQVSRLDDETERVTTVLVRSAEEDDDKKRRAPLRDEFYGPMLLRANGICPVCLYEVGECQCEDASQ